MTTEITFAKGDNVEPGAKRLKCVNEVDLYFHDNKLLESVPAMYEPCRNCWCTSKFEEKPEIKEKRNEVLRRNEEIRRKNQEED